MKKFELIVYVCIVAIVILIPWVSIGAGLYTIYINEFSFWGSVSGVCLILAGVLVNYMAKPISNFNKTRGINKTYKWF